MANGGSGFSDYHLRFGLLEADSCEDLLESDTPGKPRPARRAFQPQATPARSARIANGPCAGPAAGILSLPWPCFDRIDPPGPSQPRKGRWASSNGPNQPALGSLVGRGAATRTKPPVPRAHPLSRSWVSSTGSWPLPDPRRAGRECSDTASDLKRLFDRKGMGSFHT